MSNNNSTDTTPYLFHVHIDTYLRRLESLYLLTAATMHAFGKLAEEANKALRELADPYKMDVPPRADGSIAVAVPVAEHTKFKRVLSHYERCHAIDLLLPETILVGMVSQYDAFRGHLIRGIFKTKPEVLNASEKTFSISDLMRFGSIEAARERIIEKEIEALLRKSHSDQFDWLEKTLAIPLRKGLDIWPTFIEVTERRNLFVHTDGVVSSQYLAVCGLHNVPLDPLPKVGDRLTVDPQYLQTAYRTLREIGTKLGQVLWRKLLPNQIGKADMHINMRCVDYIADEQYDSAIRLLEFRSNLPNPIEAEMALIFKVNLAQAYKWKNEPDKCRQILSDTAWGTLADKFQLAKAVLDDDFASAAKIMRRIGKTGEVQPHDYRDWPLFRAFRNSSQFNDAYADIFGVAFATETSTENVPDATPVNLPQSSDTESRGLLEQSPA